MRFGIWLKCVCFLVYGELQSSGLFQKMSQTTDEEEHSIEMHLPYIAKVNHLPVVT